MPTEPGKVAPPSADARWRIVDATMRRHGYRRHALIEALHTVQGSFGYLDEQGLRYVAASLRAPLSQVYGAATFYHFFTLKPQGKHSCVICIGTACYLKGAPQMLAALQEDYKIEPGETTPDGEFSLLTARCLGSCGMAPSAVFDGEVSGKLTPAQVRERVKKQVGHGA